MNSLPESEQARLESYRDTLIARACQEHKVDPATMFDSSKPRRKTRARDEVVWRLRLVYQNHSFQPTEVAIPGDGKTWQDWFKLSFPRIAKLMGYKDHTGPKYAHGRVVARWPSV